MNGYFFHLLLVLIELTRIEMTLTKFVLLSKMVLIELTRIEMAFALESNTARPCIN